MDQPVGRLSLLGTPELHVQGSRRRPNMLVLRLGWACPGAVEREELIRDLGGDDANSAARNRLRVALTRLRRTGFLREQGDQIGLNPETISVDVCELRSRIADARDEPDPALEIQALAALLPQLRRPLFPELSSSWQLHAQTEWALVACEALQRLTEMAEEGAQYVLMAGAAEGVLQHFPYDPGSWNRYMRAMIQAGQATEAQQRLSAARKKAKAERWTPQEVLDAWEAAQEADAQDRLGPVLTPGESLSLERFFRRALAYQPELAIEILGSPSFRPEVIRSPRHVLPLLQEALRLGTGHTEARERIEVRVITALGILEDYPAVLQQTAQFLKRPVSAPRRRIALLAASFAHAMEGDLTAAFTAIEAAIELASGPTSEYDAWEGRAQRATFQMFKGDLSEAERALRDAIGFLQNASREGSEPDLLSIQGNLGICLAHRGHAQEAGAILRGVLESSKGLGLPAAEGLFAPVLAFALSPGLEPIGPLLAGGLRSAYRISDRRAISAAAYTGATLVLRGVDPNHEILREAYAHRLQLGIPLNALELDIFELVIDDYSISDRTVVEFVRDIIRRWLQQATV